MENLDFLERMQALSKKIDSLKNTILTEEATKNAFIMPFLGSILGYDVFDPTEVIPEFVADIAGKKGEKIDYAIMKGKDVQILIECKKCSEGLLEQHQAQLGRYFHVTNARIGILTNGILYQFFTDLDRPNIMDSRPFLEINLLDINEAMVPELKKLSKSAFDIDAIISTAGELKYLHQIKKFISSNIFSQPSDDFIKYVTTHVYDGLKTAKVIDQFRDLTKRALEEYLKDRLTERFTNAIGATTTTTAPTPPPSEELPTLPLSDAPKDSGVVTSEAEIEGFHIIKSIVRQAIPLTRVAQRDTKSYFGILVDDNNRKPLCRLHFNTAQKYIELFNEEKDGIRVPISSLDDIYQYSKQLIETANQYV